MTENIKQKQRNNDVDYSPVFEFREYLALIDFGNHVPGSIRESDAYRQAL